MRSFREDVEAAVAYHGHLCSGQCIGVKMARYGLRLLGLDPIEDRKRIMVFVETDRCPADSIGIVTGCKVGKRTYRSLDYGKIAASFVDLETRRAVRIHRKVRMHPADGEDMISFYETLPDEAIFSAREVVIDIAECDLPGMPTAIVDCHLCGEDVTDGRHVMVDGKPTCKACAGMAYYTVK